MELTVRTFGKRQYAIEVGEDDTTEKLREKVASATGLCEDGFHMEFGGEEVEDITQLSAGDTVVLTEAKAKKYEAIAALHALGERDITAGRLQVVTDVEVATLLLQAEVATAIPDDFFFQSSAVTSIDFSNVSVVDVIGKGFLHHCTSLTAVDLSGLSALTRIEDYFLSWCPALTTVNLTGLRAVTSIGASFMKKCIALTTVDLSSFRSVTTIGKWCLAECTALTAVDLSGLSALTRIESCFLAWCPALTTVNLTGLRAVTTVERRCMFECTNLKTVRGLGTCSYVVMFNIPAHAACLFMTGVELTTCKAVLLFVYLVYCSHFNAVKVACLFMTGVDWTPCIVAVLFVYLVYCAHTTVKGYL